LVDGFCLQVQHQEERIQALKFFLTSVYKDKLGGEKTSNIKVCPGKFLFAVKVKYGIF
jgi:hypothetical protein